MKVRILLETLPSESLLVKNYYPLVLPVSSKDFRSFNHLLQNRPAMNYDKLSRSLRYYYEKGIMSKGKLVY